MTGNWCRGWYPAITVRTCINGVVGEIVGGGGGGNIVPIISLKKLLVFDGLWL